MKNDINKKESLLLKKIKDLTEADKEKLFVALGTADLPFPMYGNVSVESNGKKVKERRLTSIQSNNKDGVMHVYSERPYDEVVAMSYCNMPVPSMLSYYKYALEQRKPDHKRRIQVLIGDPGAGKSFMGAELARVQSNRPVHVLDCGGKNMRELLFEMVLDFGSADGLQSAIDKKMASNTMSDLGLSLVRKLKEVNVEQPTEIRFAGNLLYHHTNENSYVNLDSNDKATVNWDVFDAKYKEKEQEISSQLEELKNLKPRKALAGVLGQVDLTQEMINEKISNAEKNAAAEMEALETTKEALIKLEKSNDVFVERFAPKNFVKELENGKIEIDWAGLSSSSENTEKALKILKEISSVEGLDDQGGNALGMNSQYGPLITTFLSGDPIVLDEYNKSKEGTDDNLQTVLQFFNGEIDECTVENPLKNKDGSAGPSEFTFRREDMKASCFLTVTGNAAVDGVTTRELNKSVYSRIEPLVIPEPTLMDWKHRIGQIMTGMPVSTIYETFKEDADNDPVEFGEFLLDIRKKHAEIQGMEVPKIQETFLRNWQNVVNASDKLARFYDGWKKTIDPDVGPSMHAQLGAENIDESYSAQVSIDFRKIIQHMEEAFRITPQQVKVGVRNKFNRAALKTQTELKPSSDQELSVEFGTRYTNILSDKVYETSAARGKKELYKVLTALSEECGLTDVVLQEAAKSNQKSVEDALNLSAFDEKDPSKKAVFAQTLLCDHIREKNPEVKQEDNDKIISIVRVREALAKLKDLNEGVNETIMLVPNTDPRSLDLEPLIEVEVVESDEQDEEYINNLSGDDLVSYDSLMASFAFPDASNQKAIWYSKINELINEDNPDLEKPEAKVAEESIEDFENTKAAEISENRSESGLGITTVIAKDIVDGEKDLAEVHIIRNENKDKTVIIGNPISDRLSKVFNEAGIVHINKNDNDASSKIDDAVNDLLRGMSDEDRGKYGNSLKLAFNLRMDLPGEKDNTISKKIEDMALSEIMFYPGIENNAPKYLIAKIK